MPYFVNTKKPNQGSNTSFKNNSKYWENISCLIQVSKIMFNFVKKYIVITNILPKIIRKLRCFLRTLIFCIRESDYRKEFSNKVRFVIGMCVFFACLHSPQDSFCVKKKQIVWFWHPNLIQQQYPYVLQAFFILSKWKSLGVLFSSIKSSLVSNRCPICDAILLKRPHTTIAP